jgi:hypothetical protein
MRDTRRPRCGTRLLTVPPGRPKVSVPRPVSAASRQSANDNPAHGLRWTALNPSTCPERRVRVAAGGSRDTFDPALASRSKPGDLRSAGRLGRETGPQLGFARWLGRETGPQPRFAGRLGRETATRVRRAARSGDRATTQAMSRRVVDRSDQQVHGAKGNVPLRQQDKYGVKNNTLPPRGGGQGGGRGERLVMNEAPVLHPRTPHLGPPPQGWRRLRSLAVMARPELEANGAKSSCPGLPPARRGAKTLPRAPKELEACGCRNVWIAVTPSAEHTPRPATHTRSPGSGRLP